MPALILKIRAGIWCLPLLILLMQLLSFQDDRVPGPYESVRDIIMLYLKMDEAQKKEETAKDDAEPVVIFADVPSIVDVPVRQEKAPESMNMGGLAYARQETREALAAEDIVADETATESEPKDTRKESVIARDGDKLPGFLLTNLTRNNLLSMLRSRQAYMLCNPYLFVFEPSDEITDTTIGNLKSEHVYRISEEVISVIPSDVLRDVRSHFMSKMATTCVKPEIRLSKLTLLTIQGLQKQLYKDSDPDLLVLTSIKMVKRGDKIRFVSEG